MCALYTHGHQIHHLIIINVVVMVGVIMSGGAVEEEEGGRRKGRGENWVITAVCWLQVRRRRLPGGAVGSGLSTTYIEHV